jgi:YD repeat-containing protein
MISPPQRRLAANDRTAFAYGNAQNLGESMSSSTHSEDFAPGARRLRSARGRLCGRRFRCATLPAAALLACGLTTWSGSAAAADLVPPKVFTTTPGGINLSDGVYTETNTDISVGSMTLERFHLGVAQVSGQPVKKDPNDPFFGEHVSHNWDIYVAQNRKPDNLVPTTYKPIVHFGLSASGIYHEQAVSLQDPTVRIRPYSVEAMRGSLAYDAGGNYVYTDQAGTVYTFDKNIPALGVVGNSQRAKSIAYADGRLVTLSYNSAKQLKLVADNLGYALVFDYAADGNVSAACGLNTAFTYVSVASTCAGASPRVSYAYATNRLTSVTSATGGVTTYSYTDANLSTSTPAQLCIRPPGYTSCKIRNVYNSYEQVKEQELAGQLWTFILSAPISRDPEKYVEQSRPVSVTDPTQRKSTYWFYGTTLNEVVEPRETPAGTFTSTKYVFTGAADFDQDPAVYPNEGSILESVTQPEGNQYAVTNAGPYVTVSSESWTPKPGSGLPTMTRSYGYLDCATTPRAQCTKPIWRKDPNNAQTDYTYNAKGQLLTELAPAATTGAARTLKVFTYADRQAWVKNSLGALVAASAVSLPSTETLCQAVAGSSPPVCNTSGPMVTTTYEYGAAGTTNNLLVRGKVVTADGQTRRTCFAYDTLGRKISETTPRANLATCP